MTDIDFTTRIETEDSFLGPIVLLVRRKIWINEDGTRETLTRAEPLPAVIAVGKLLDTDNGRYWDLGHIEWGPVFDEWSY